MSGGPAPRCASMIRLVCSPVRRSTGASVSPAGRAAPCRDVREPPACTTTPPESVSEMSITLSKSSSSTPEERSSRGAPSSSGLVPSITSAFANESESRVPGRGISRAAARPAHSTDPSGAASEETETYPRSPETSPSRTVYSNDSSPVPEPETYEADPSDAPVSKASDGTPVTSTLCVNLTDTPTVWPMPYVPSSVWEPTPETTAGRNRDIMRITPLSSLSSSSWYGAPTAISAVPSLSRSPSTAIEEPMRSPPDRPGTSPNSTARLAVPSAFIRSTQPVPPPPERGAPAAMSGTPSRSRSPTPATDAPNQWSPEMAGPPPDESPILDADMTPVLLISRTWTAPLSAPDAPRPSSPGAPAAMSGTPLPSMSPTPATEYPSMSWSCRSRAWSRGTFIALHDGPPVP